MVVSQDFAIDELYNRGIVPRYYVHTSRVPWVENNHFEVDRTGPILAHRYDDMHLLHDEIPYYDHGSYMVEIHRRDGIEWQLIRAAVSQPYMKRAQLLSQTTAKVENLGLRMTICDDLTWWYSDTTLAVYTPIEPITFDVFCRTFHYWMVVNVSDGRLREGFLPTNLTQPTDNFYFYISRRERDVLNFGISETLLDIWEHIRDLDCIEYETLKFLWYNYRNRVFTPTFLAMRFIARLRARRQDRIDHTPPFGRRFLESCLTPMGVDNFS